MVWLSPATATRSIHAPLCAAIVRSELNRTGLLRRPHHAAIVAAGYDTDAGRMNDSSQKPGVRMGLEALVAIGKHDAAIAKRDDGFVNGIEQGGNDEFVVGFGRQGHGGAYRQLISLWLAERTFVWLD
jgi:hypothetical protein